MDEKVIFSLSLFFISSVLTSISQIMLKVSANKKYKSLIYEYANWYVIFSYSLFILITIIKSIAYKNIDYKYGPIMSTLSYVFIMCMSIKILKEKNTINKTVGVILIIVGIIIFNIN